jgi:periplasmic divalent cation tolerance protein
VRQLDPDDDRAPYLQVAEAIREAIADGYYRQGDPLPSRAHLAEHFSVAPMTVQNALRVLRDEGVIVSRQGSGVFVRTVPAAPRDLAADTDDLIERVDQIQQLLAEHGLGGREGDGYSRGMVQIWQVQVTAPTEEAATELARAAVEARLAAGGQVLGPVTSVFWHLGEFGTGQEWLAVLKTTETRYKDLERLLVEQHEWTNPEITAVPLAAGLAPYLDWVDRTTTE